MRKQIIEGPAEAARPQVPGLDIAALAVVQVTSEDPAHPIDLAFDGQCGPGATRWIAARPGDQQVIVVFDQPQAIARIDVEIEEPTVTRTQELELALSEDGGQTYRQIVRQEFNFSPPGTVFERETWTVTFPAVTHVRLSIKPDKGGKPTRASLSALVMHRPSGA